MSTSAEVGPTDGRVVRLRPVPYEHPVARQLVDRVQREYVTRYGGPDEAVVDPAEFAPPAGLFLVAEVDGVPAGCGAWRVHEAGVVEVKRVYVEPGFRRRGLAQVLVRALEASAAAAGHRAVVLNTGDRQPEALALYAALGYTPAPGYGRYADSPGAVFLGKDLPADGVDQDRPRQHGEEGPWAPERTAS
ncbi:GNAT family N-acetyltransferase [Geodermatophilus ruber]|uniref:Acetyltransferase (GNAT) family protein n=1 Tax=Geodermatophilus ruber TaxID=504800 RepID=A0A1I4I373_9ACTN|nr:GNAT family N-acetyltransferase [Geodermatophilus ruber]SFL48557.1 Acetyltransferase (GNAT) family protein [Geodermatophilus ruber]